MSGPIKINSRSQWASINPVLVAGEIGIESHIRNVKIGDGLDAWNKLPYFGCPCYWGAFWDETSQIAAAINTPTAIMMRESDESNYDVHVESNSQIKVNNPGVYSITFSIQFTNDNTAIHDINVWLRKNGTDVPASDSRFSITAKHGGVDGNLIGTINYVVALSANDYFQLIWATSDVNAYIHAESAQVSPFTHPSIPGIICTVVQVASA